MDDNKDFGRITDITCEFLEAAVHTILCIRSVYPRAVFKAARKFGAPIRMSRHPKLNKYIADVIGGVHKCMMKGLVHRVEVLILNHLENHKIIEKYIFEVGLEQDGIPKLDKRTMDHLSRTFGSFFIRLMSIDMTRPKLKDLELGFKMRLYTSVHDRVIDEDWISVEIEPETSNLRTPPGIGLGSSDRLDTEAKGTVDKSNSTPAVKKPSIIPIHSMNVPFPLALNLIAV